MNEEEKAGSIYRQAAARDAQSVQDTELAKLETAAAAAMIRRQERIKADAIRRKTLLLEAEAAREKLEDEHGIGTVRSFEFPNGEIALFVKGLPVVWSSWFHSKKKEEDDLKFAVRCCVYPERRRFEELYETYAAAANPIVLLCGELYGFSSAPDPVK